MKNRIVAAIAIATFLGFSVPNIYAQTLGAFGVSPKTDSTLLANRDSTTGTYAPFLKMETALSELALQKLSDDTEGLVSGVEVDSTSDSVLIYVYPDHTSKNSDVSSSLQSHGYIPLAYNDFSQVPVWVPISKLSDVTALAHVGYLQAVRPRIFNSIPTNSTADGIQKCDSVRYKYNNADGDGVYIGIISDDFGTGPKDNPNIIKSLKDRGVLPAYEILDDNYKGTRTHEGLAIAELIHNIAPKAHVVFAQAGDDAATMVNSIVHLVDGTAADVAARVRTPKCQIIIDDVSDPSESSMDNSCAVDHAIEYAVHHGVFYVTSAGNFARDIYDFVGTRLTSLKDNKGVGHTVYAFGKMPYNPIYVPKKATLRIALQWDDTPSTIAHNKYDVLVYDPLTAKIVTQTEVKPGQIMPALQMLDFPNDREGQMFGVAIQPFDHSPSTTQRFSLLIHNSDRLTPPLFHDCRASIIGHSLSSYAFTCAAISQFNDDKRYVHGDSSFKKRSVYSSAGARNDVKPDEAFIDQSETHVPGFHIFSGTSAAAAHAAGLAAMMISYQDHQKKPHLAPEQIKRLICDPKGASSTGVLDVGSHNNETGYGLVDAMKTFHYLSILP